jgi:hypothetical protein
MLDERATLLGLQEMNLWVREAILSGELESGMRHPNRLDLSVELDETHARVHEIADDRATKVGWLSRRLIRVAGVLIDLGMSVVGQNPLTGVDRQHESREARSLYLSALQLTRALRLRFVGRAT